MTLHSRVLQQHKAWNRDTAGGTIFNKTLEYIHLNPVMAGFVTGPEDWEYRSVRNFCGMKGLIELSFS